MPRPPHPLGIVAVNIKHPHGISCFLINDVKRDLAASRLGPRVSRGLNLVGVPLAVVKNDDFAVMHSPVAFSEELQLWERLSIGDGIMRFDALLGRVILAVLVVCLRVWCYP